MTMEKSVNSLRQHASNLIASLLLGALLTACGNPSEVKVPPYVLEQEKMAAVIADIHVVEGARMGREVMGDTLHSDFYFEKVYDKHGISRSDFDTSFSFYSAYPRIMNEIYEEAIEQLNKMEMQAGAPKDIDLEKPKKDIAKKDSLNPVSKNPFTNP